MKNYVEIFKALNDEEQIIKSEGDCQKLKDFYEKKNDVSMQFIKEMNRGSITDATFQIVYYDSYEFYFTKILIFFNEGEEYFTILPPVLVNQENAPQELFNFLDKSVHKTGKDLEDIGNFSRGGPFSIIEKAVFRRDFFLLNESLRQINTTFSGVGIVKASTLNKFRKRCKRFEARFQKSVKKQMKKHLLTYEEADFLQTMLNQRFSNGFKENREELFLYLIKGYGIEFMKKIKNTLLYSSLEKFKPEESSFEDFIAVDQKGLLSDLRLSQRLFNTLIESDKNLPPLCKNAFLYVEQASALMQRIISLESNIQKDPLFEELLSRHNLSDEEVALLCNGTEEEKAAILQHARNIPQNLIKEIVGNLENEKQDNILHILRNNTLSRELLEEVFQFARTTARENEFYERLMTQQHLPQEIIKTISEMAISPLVVENFLKRFDRPQEVAENFAISPNSFIREIVAKAILEGRVVVREEIFYCLAMDRELEDSIRIEMQNRSEFVENLPEINEFQFLHIRFNTIYKKGITEYFINDVLIFIEKINIGGPFEKFCYDHKKAILIIAEKQELYTRFEMLQSRVYSLEAKAAKT